MIDDLIGHIKEVLSQRRHSSNSAPFSAAEIAEWAGERKSVGKAIRRHRRKRRAELLRNGGES